MESSQLLVLLKQDFFRGYELLFKQYYKSLHKLATSIVRDEAIAEDIVQQFFVQSSTAFQSGRVQSLESYLYVSIKHACFNYIRKHHRECALDFAYNTQAIENPQLRIEQRELRKRVKRAIKSLPEKCRAIFEMGYLQGLSHEQIAQSENISVHTVSNQMTKALRLLRLQLAPVVKHLLVLVYLVFG